MEAATRAIGADDPATEFQARAAAGACLGVAHIAPLRRTSDEDTPDLPALFREAFTATFGHDL